MPWWVAQGEEDEFLAATPYIRSVWMWREILRRCNDFFSLPDVQASGRVMSVRYEELMADPIGVGERVVAHVGGTMTKTVRKRLLTGHTKSIGAHRRRDPAEDRDGDQLADPSSTASATRADEQPTPSGDPHRRRPAVGRRAPTATCARRTCGPVAARSTSSRSSNGRASTSG